MGKIFTVLFLCFFQLCNAQIVVSGNVLSDEKSPIQDVQILTEEGLFLSKTDAKGYFELEISQSQTIVFSHILYKDYSLDLNDISGSLEIYLSLHLDSYGQLFLKCVSNVYFLYEELDGILSTEMNKAEFESSIEPLVIGDEEVKIYSSFDPTFPEFNYYLQNGSDQNVKDIYTITDSVLMHTFRAQYRDLSPRSKLEAYRSELETGIDKEIISGYMAGFHNSIYFKPPYAPIFKLDSGYLVVDIPSSKMVFLNKEGEVLNAIKVSFHEQSKAKGWKNLMASRFCRIVCQSLLRIFF